MKTRTAIAEGKTIAEPLQGSKVFPGMVVQMISVGEQTGAMDAMLGKIADFYDDEVDAAVDALTSLLEPMLMVVLGGSVGVAGRDVPADLQDRRGRQLARMPRFRRAAIPRAAAAGVGCGRRGCRAGAGDLPHCAPRCARHAGGRGAGASSCSACGPARARARTAALAAWTQSRRAACTCSSWSATTCWSSGFVYSSGGAGSIFGFLFLVSCTAALDPRGAVAAVRSCGYAATSVVPSGACPTAPRLRPERADRREGGRARSPPRCRASSRAGSPSKRPARELQELARTTAHRRRRLERAADREPRAGASARSTARRSGSPAGGARR